MTFWILLGFMCLLATGFVWIPQRQALTVAMAILCATSSFALYSMIGNPTLISREGELAHMVDMTEAMAARLQETPDDRDGWIQLSHLYLSIDQYASATRALRRAVIIEHEGNPTTLATLGEAMYLWNGEIWNDDIVDVFEKALTIDPEHTAALFWGGAGAAAKGDLTLAIERWETLLAMHPGAASNQILRQGLLEWRDNR